MNTQKLIWGALTLLLLAALALTACAQQATPVATETPIQIAFFGPAHNSYVAASYQGILDVANKEGAEVTFFDTGFDPSVAYKQIQDAISRGKFDAFIILPLDPMILVPAVEQAIAAGIQVVNTDYPIGPDVNSNCPQIKGQAGTVLMTPNQRWENRAIQIPEVCKDLDPCNIGVLLTLANQETDKAVIAGLEVLEQKYPNIHVVSIQPTGAWTAESAIPVTQNMLIAHPEINVIAVATSQHVSGVMAVLNATGRTDIRIMGNGATCPEFEYIRNGLMYSTVIEAPYTEGKVAAEVAIQAVRGELTEPACKNSAEEAGAGPVFYWETLNTFECQWDG
jgi:ribose transport system substrate-binding protein